MNPIQRRRIILPNRNKFDAAATAYFAATGITNPLHQAAINTYIVGLKNAGLFSKITARYLTFNNATTAAINLVSPTTFQGTIVNAPTINATGYTASTTSYFRTGVIPLTHLTALDFHAGLYLIGTGVNSNKIMGCSNTTNHTTQRVSMTAGSSTDTAEVWTAASTASYANGGASTHYSLATKSSSVATNQLVLYRNGVSQNTNTPSGNTLPSQELLFDGYNDGSTGSMVATPQGAVRKYGLFTVGKFLTSTEALSDHNLTTTLLQTLGLI